MIDAEKTVLTAVATALSSAYPNMPVYGIPPSLPPDLPCVMLIEIDSATAKDTLDSSGAENHADVMYQIDVYSNLVQGRKEQCRAILDIADNEMRRLGFRRTMKEQLPNPSDESIYRMTARYVARIGKDLTFYGR